MGAASAYLAITPKPRARMTTHAHAYTLAIVHAEPFLRQSLHALFTVQPHCTVQLQAPGAPALKRAVATGLLPGLVLLCAEMAGADGCALLRWLARHLPAARVLLLGRPPAPDYLPDALCAGAHGYFCTLLGHDRLLLMAGLLLQGALLFPPETHRALHGWRQAQQPQQPGPRPSPAHCEFLHWAAHPDQLTYEEIARRMGRSPRAVEKYRATLFKRHNIKSRVGLVSLATLLGLHP